MKSFGFFPPLPQNINKHGAECKCFLSVQVVLGIGLALFKVTPTSPKNTYDSVLKLWFLQSPHSHVNKILFTTLMTHCRDPPCQVPHLLPHLQSLTFYCRSPSSLEIMLGNESRSLCPSPFLGHGAQSRKWAPFLEQPQ